MSDIGLLYYTHGDSQCSTNDYKNSI